MIQLTPWDMYAFFSYKTLLYVSPMLMIGIAALLFIPTLRARRRARPTILVLIATQLVLLASASPMLGEVWKNKQQAVVAATATRHLSQPQTFGGIRFPAGSMVRLAEDGRVELGKVPQATVIMGAPLIGSFSLAGDSLVGKPGIAEGTLARPAILHGLPCQPGPLFVRGSDVRCVLSRDIVLGGYVLAKGHTAEVLTGMHGSAELQFGTLARSERLFQVLWPVGTVIGKLDKTPARLAESLGQDGEVADFCLPAGIEASVGPALLHGPMSYTVQGGRRLIMGGCYLILGDVEASGGYALVGNQRYGSGERSDAAASWTWSKPAAATPR